MPRPGNSAERRLQIARAFRKVMAAKGYDGASITDVAAEAGLAPGLVHYHFENKLQILLAVLADLLGGHARALEEALARADGDPAAQLDAFLDLHLATGKHADPEGLACWIALMGEALRHPEVREAYDRATGELIARLVRVIEAGLARGEFRGADPKVAAAALMAAIQGYFVLAATAREQIPRRSAATAVKAMARGLLDRAEPATKSKRR